MTVRTSIILSWGSEIQKNRDRHIIVPVPYSFSFVLICLLFFNLNYLPFRCFPGMAERTASAVFAAAGAAALSAAAVFYFPDHNGCEDQEDDQTDDKS